VILQGEVYWADMDEPRGSEPGFSRPVIILTADEFNASRISTVIVCPCSTTLRLAASPGNVLLAEGEGGLPRASVANVSAIETVDKARLRGPLGRIAPSRLRQVIRGLNEILGQR